MRWGRRRSPAGLAGQRILITGAASGLGRALSERAFARGAMPLLVDVNKAVEELAEQLSTRSLVCDLSQPEAAQQVVEWSPEIDVLVNNAGIATKAEFHSMDTDRILRLVDLNVRAPALLARRYAARFVARGSGAIVNVASSTAYFPTPTLAPYGASKSFLVSLTEALLLEYARTPIRVLGVCPSGFQSNFQRASGVKNERPERLLDPVWLADGILDLIEANASGVFDFGWSTYLFRTLRRSLPRSVFNHLVGRLLVKYR